VAPDKEHLVEDRLQALRRADAEIGRQQAENERRRVVLGVSSEQAAERALEAARGRLRAMPQAPPPVEEYRPLAEATIAAILERHPAQAPPWGGAPVLAYHPGTGQLMPADIAAEDTGGFLVRLTAGEAVTAETLRRVRWAPGRPTWVAP